MKVLVLQLASAIEHYTVIKGFNKGLTTYSASSAPSKVTSSLCLKVLCDGSISSGALTPDFRALEVNHM